MAYVHWTDEPEVEEEGGLDEAPLTRTGGVVGFPALKFSDGERWKDRAKCLGQTDLTKLFFAEGPVKGKKGKSRKDVIDQAKAICAECSVRKECFNFAKKNNFLHGVWGGVDFHAGNGTKKHIPEYVD